MTAKNVFRIYAADPGVRVMAAVAAAGLTLTVVRSDRPIVWLFLLGWALYLLEEHLIHRFVFHAPAPRHQFLFDLLYRLHYGHHDQVRSRHLLFTPLWFALPITALTIAALTVVLPFVDTLIAILGGSVCAYLLFEWLHLTSHVRMPKGRVTRNITRRHAKHHYIDHHNWYTVSPGGQLVDKALGSDPSTSRAQLVSPSRTTVVNVHTCGLDPQDPRLVRSRARFGVDTSLIETTPVPADAHSGSEGRAA
jgi:hypothetical protein